LEECRPIITATYSSQLERKGGPAKVIFYEKQDYWTSLDKVMTNTTTSFYFCHVRLKSPSQHKLIEDQLSKGYQHSGANRKKQEDLTASI
jgi:hypothetical protein